MDNLSLTRFHTIRCRSSRHLPCASALLIAVIALLVPRAAGQCLQWTDGPFGGVVFGSDVNDMITFDLDGGGPQPARLIAAGNGVWVWDMVNWRRLGEGLADATALFNFNGTLVAAAQYPGAPPTYAIVRWNGNGWVQMGGVFNGEIRDFAIFQGQLIAGGAFTNVGGVGASRVARWDGSTWSGLGTGVDVSITALAVFDLDGSGGNAARLIVGGIDNSSQFSLPFEALWTGSDWIYPPKHTLPCTPLDFLVAGGRLYVCGARPEFGTSGTEAILASWDEDHWRFEEQVDSFFGEDDWMSRMTEWNGDLVIVGRFEYEGSENVLLYDGSTAWPMLGGRPDFEQTAVCVFGPNVAVARRLHEVAQYNVAAWVPVNSSGYGNAFATFGSRLVVGGAFTRNTSDGEVAYNLIGWNGSTRSKVGGGTNGPVHALEGFLSGSDQLIVGGSFTIVGEGIAAMNVNNIALRTEPLLIAGTWSPMGNGFNGPVLAVERVPANQFFDEFIVAAGQFTAAGTGSPTFGRVAQWSGSPPAWSAMGAGFNSTVRALKSYSSGPTGRIVIAGGDFTIAGSVQANRIASWGTPGFPEPAWAAMGSGFNGSVHAIERYSGATYAAGAFTASGATTLNRIARWDTSLNPDAWVPVGNGTGFNGTVRALLVDGAFLYAAGDFTSIDGVPSDHIARWDGSVWADADSNSDAAMLALATYRGEVHAGLASDDTSRRRLAAAPWIIQQPVSETASCGGNAIFTFAAAPGYNGTMRTWRKDGVPISGGPTGHGSWIAFNIANSISISNVRELDAGLYDCVISPPGCTSVTSVAVTLTVPGTCPPCPADTNGDATVNVDDLFWVIIEWGACQLTCPPGRCASDVAPFPGGNCVTDTDDLIAIIIAWGACP
jgi:hypothetical protein